MNHYGFLIINLTSEKVRAQPLRTVHFVSRYGCRQTSKGPIVRGFKIRGNIFGTDLLLRERDMMIISKLANCAPSLSGPTPHPFIGSRSAMYDEYVIPIGNLYHTPKGSKITISLPTLCYKESGLEVVYIGDIHFHMQSLKQIVQLRTMLITMLRGTLHVVNSNYLKLCRGGGCNGMDRTGDLGEREVGSDISRRLKERERERDEEGRETTHSTARNRRPIYDTSIRIGSRSNEEKEEKGS